MSKLAGAAFVAAVASVMAVVTARHDTSSATLRSATSHEVGARPTYACDFTEKGVRIHAEARPASGVIGQAYPGDGFSVVRWYAAGSSWVYGSDTTTGRTGWVYADYLSTACRNDGQ